MVYIKKLFRHSRNKWGRRSRLLREFPPGGKGSYLRRRAAVTKWAHRSQGAPTGAPHPRRAWVSPQRQSRIRPPSRDAPNGSVQLWIVPDEQRSTPTTNRSPSRREIPHGTVGTRIGKIPRSDTLESDFRLGMSTSYRNHITRLRIVKRTGKTCSRFITGMAQDRSHLLLRDSLLREYLQHEKERLQKKKGAFR